MDAPYFATVDESGLRTYILQKKGHPPSVDAMRQGSRLRRFPWLKE